MPAAYIIGLLFLLQVAGCTASGPAPAVGVFQGGTVFVEKLPSASAQEPAGTGEPLPGAATPGGSVVVEKLPPDYTPARTITLEPPPLPATPGGTVIVEQLAADTAQVQAGTGEPARPTANPGGTLIVERLPPAAEAPVVAAPVSDRATPPVTVAPTENIAKPDKAAVTAPAKAVAPAVRDPQPPKPPAATPARAEPQALPSLALATLEQRLKDTNAIGLFTKIAVKNQVDDLLKQFKTHYDSGGKAPSAQLRQTYEQLLLKVHELVKEGDPALASAVANSRDAIWNVLTDPVKFAKL